MIAHSSINAETEKVMGVLRRALNVFGGDVEPTLPPRFAADRHIEDNLGCGRF